MGNCVSCCAFESGHSQNEPLFREHKDEEYPYSIADRNINSGFWEEQDVEYHSFRSNSGFSQEEVSSRGGSSPRSFMTALCENSSEEEDLQTSEFHSCPRESTNPNFHVDKVESWLFSSNNKEEGFQDVEASGVMTNEGGSVKVNGVQLTCPPGAVDNPVRIKLGLEEPYLYCGMVVDNGLQNDVIFATPIINCQPNAQVFKKQVTLTIALDSDKERFTHDALLILHGSQTNKGEITWEDITHNSKLVLEKNELEVEISQFSLIAVLVRLTWLHAKEIVTRFNFMSFKYTLSVLFKTSHQDPFVELTLVFMSQDMYQEEFYREHSDSALTRLKSNGFEEVGCSVNKDSNYIYNKESLTVSIQLGVDYKLANNQPKQIELSVDSSVWWSKGHVIKLPLQGSSTDAKILCGRIVVQGQHGHFRENHFCQLDLFSYVRRLLRVENAIFNLKPVSENIGLCDAETWSQVVACWQSEDKQLEMILQRWQMNLVSEEGPGILKTYLMGLQPEEYKVKERGQMHIDHLRELAAKIVSLQHKDLNMMKYLGNEIKVLCKSILRDCCIEMATSKEDLDWATSAENHGSVLLIHKRISQNVAEKYDQMCSSPVESITANFLFILPHLVQTIKEIFRDEKTSQVQTGLHGIAEEATLLKISSDIQDAVQNKSILRLLSEVCNILENLCLNNRDASRSTGQITEAEIHKWGDSAMIFAMLDFLKTFFESSEGHRLYKRLEIFAASTRKIMSNPSEFEGNFLRDFLNVALNLFKFAKFDPSQLVRFELNIDLAASSNTRGNDLLKYEKSQEIFSQLFWISKESENELQLEAIAHVHIDGRPRRIGAFETMVILPESCSEAIDKLPIASLSVAVKREQDYWGNLCITLYATQKDDVIKALKYLEQELGDQVVDLKKDKITQSHLRARSFAKAGTVVRLRLIHKWGSETISLDSNDFVALADSTAGGACVPDLETAAVAGQLVTSKKPSLLPTKSDSTAGSSNVSSFLMDPSHSELIQRHLQEQSGRIEIHYHQSFMKGHVCVSGKNTSLNMQMPATASGQRCLEAGSSTVPQRSITAEQGE